ncbi:cell surface spherulin 4-like protein [Aphelenchoides avenae]|nr:cell surface spherulin 4-like protein [Aphelenchus avenae]
MASFVVVLASLGTVASAATSVLLPLYVYPSNGGWDPVYAAVSANPSVDFLVVVNPDSGPGAGTYPNSDYVTGIAKLNSYSNVKTIGYVHTTYGKDPTSVIEKNITKYAGWSDYTSQNIAVQGIFFDETNSSSAVNSYMQTVSEFAYNTIPSVPRLSQAEF